MIFKGDLSKYHPADAMMFLAQVGVDGVLSVVDRDCIIALTFKAGRLLDAQSAEGDSKLLRCLRHDGRLNDSQVRQIQHIQRETGLSVRQILGKLDFFPLADIQPVLKLVLFEVLRQMFLLDQGRFDFTETPLEDDGAQIRLDPSKATLKILPQADEYRSFIKSIHSIDRLIQIRKDVKNINFPTASGQLVLNLAAQQRSVKELMEIAPLPAHDVMQLIQRFLAQGLISLQAGQSDPPVSMKPVLDPMFAAYKQALKTLLGTREVLKRLDALVTFGKIYYEHMLILTAKQGQLIHCKTVNMDPRKGMTQKSLKGNFGSFDKDPVLSTICRSGLAFFGKSFPCALLDQFIDQSSEGECALIPMLISSNLSILLYAYTTKNASGLCPHHYLELLSWVVVPAQSSEALTAEAQPGAADAQAETTDKTVLNKPHPSVEEAQKRIAAMVAHIKELPPLPTLVSKALQMLSDPDSAFEDIEAVISRDQALVAKLIKVGNSALYGGLQRVTSLRQVLTRLGLKITRNLVMTASTRSYFLNNRKTMRVWGHLLWQHAVETGLAARRIAETVRYPDPEEAFIGGLIHDIGKLIILMLFVEPYKEILKLKKLKQVTSKSAETQVLGCDHEWIGRLLMDQWNMPDSAKACAEFHHSFHDAETYADLVAIVGYADLLSRQYGTNPEPLLDEDHTYGQALTETLDLSESLQAALVEGIIDDFQKADSMMD